MRDSIDHDEGLMTPRSSTRRAPKVAARQAKIADPVLRELVAHLGRLLAQEYVALLAQGKQTEAVWKEEAP